MDKTQLEALLTSLDWWAGFFTLLVVVGVGGEFIMHIWSSRTSGRLIAIQRMEEQELRDKVTQAERENLEIRRQIADRFLTNEERKILLQVGGAGRNMTVTFIQDRESAEYAQQIFDTFKQAGWYVGKNQRLPYDPDPLPHGVICRVSKSPDSLIKAVIGALGKVGANPRIEEAPSQQDSFIEIIVGAKPKA